MEAMGKKPELGLLITADKPKGLGGAHEEESDDPKVNAARGIREAIESGDDQALADAFQTMVDACKGYGEEPAEEMTERRPMAGMRA
jgi:hypothetical protein